ncbi:MAG TPA: hypothetical protein ENI74_01275 [Gammaproteobacteria bacterium]|nr:hypothetical protein [Gammaproteobacteria bacterium]
MTEPTVTCPNCKMEIKLTESMAAPLIESTRLQFGQQDGRLEWLRSLRFSQAGMFFSFKSGIAINLFVRELIG